PVMVLTPLLGEAATTSWPPWRRMATVFEPIRPVPPMTTIFMVSPSLCNPGGKIVRGFPNQHKRRGDRLGSAEGHNARVIPGSCPRRRRRARHSFREEAPLLISHCAPGAILGNVML